MLEKPGVPNLAACENQGKQWKSKVMKKKQTNRGWWKKAIKIDWNTSFNKRFYRKKGK